MCLLGVPCILTDDCMLTMTNASEVVVPVAVDSLDYNLMDACPNCNEQNFLDTALPVRLRSRSPNVTIESYSMNAHCTCGAQLFFPMTLRDSEVGLYTFND